MAVASRSWACGTSNTVPARRRRTAPATRKLSAVMPRAKPTVVTTMPNAVKAIASPTPKASGPNRLALKALATTIGRSGRTHGFKMVTSPATKARISSPTVRRQLGLYDNPATISWRSRVRSVSPMLRAVSLSP